MERSRANKNRFKLRSAFRQTETETTAPEEPTTLDRFMSMGKTLGNSKVKPYAKIDMASKYTFKPVSEEELEKKQGKSAERKVNRKRKKMGDEAFFNEVTGTNTYSTDKDK
tara:strand:- start:201 stop:533 length:333 start_codon:yes stop_codon:yes gene_type:complete